MFNVQIDLVDNEKIEFAKGSNHFKGIEGVGGKLFVTNKRVVLNHIQSMSKIMNLLLNILIFKAFNFIIPWELYLMD